MLSYSLCLHLHEQRQKVGTCGSAFYTGATAATSETHRKLVNGQKNPSCVEKTGRLHRTGWKCVTETAVALRDRIFAVNYLSYCFVYFPIIQISAQYLLLSLCRSLSGLLQTFITTPLSNIRPWMQLFGRGGHQTKHRP